MAKDKNNPPEPDVEADEKESSPEQELGSGDVEQKKVELEGQVDDDVDKFENESPLDPAQQEAANPGETENLDRINNEAETAGEEAKEKIEEAAGGGEEEAGGAGEPASGEGAESLEAEPALEDVKTQELQRFFQSLSLKEFQDINKLRDKFDVAFTDEQVEKLNKDVCFRDDVAHRYFNDFIDRAEQFLMGQVRMRAAREESENKIGSTLKREAKKFGKGVWGGGLYAVANRAVITGLKGVTAVGLPVKILAGGLTGAAVSGFNHAMGRVGEAVTAKGIEGLAKKLEKSGDSERINSDMRRIFAEDFSVLMEFDRDREQKLAVYKEQLGAVDVEDLNQIFSGSPENGELNEKRDDLIELIELTSNAKTAAGPDQDYIIKERQGLIKKLIDNKGLDEFVTHQINKQFEFLKREGKLTDEEKQRLVKQAHLMVERDMNAILGDVIAQEKFAEVDKKGKSFFERGYTAKLLGKAPAESVGQAMWNGFISGGLAGLARTDATAGAIYMAAMRVQGTLRAEIGKHGEKIVKTSDEIMTGLNGADVDTLEEGQVKDLIKDARARVKLPDIKEVDRSKIEKLVANLENSLIIKAATAEISEESNLEIKDLAGQIVGGRQEEIEEAADLAKRERKSKGIIGLTKTFFTRTGNKDKAKILLKAGWEGFKGGAAGALGGEIVNMGGVAFAGGEVDIESSFGRIVDRASFGLYGEAREALGGGHSEEEQQQAGERDEDRARQIREQGGGSRDETGGGQEPEPGGGEEWPAEVSQRFQDYFARYPDAQAELTEDLASLGLSDSEQAALLASDLPADQIENFKLAIDSLADSFDSVDLLNPVEKALLNEALSAEGENQTEAIENLAARMYNFSGSLDHTGVSTNLLSEVKNVDQLAGLEQQVNGLSQAFAEAGVSEDARQAFTSQVDSPEDIQAAIETVQKIDGLLSDNLNDRSAPNAGLRAQAFANMERLGGPDGLAVQLALENKMGVSSFDQGGIDAADLTKIVAGAESNNPDATAVLHEWSTKGMVGSSTIEAGGNLWNSTKEIVASDPEKYGLSDSPSSAEVNAAVSRALVNLAENQGGEIKDLVHEGDTLYMTSDGKLVFGATSGIEAASLDDLSTMKDFVSLEADPKFDIGDNMNSCVSFHDKMGNEGYNYELRDGTKIQIMNVDRDDAVEVRVDGKSMGEMTQDQFKDLLLEKRVITPHVEPEPEPEKQPQIDQKVVDAEVASMLHDAGIRDTSDRTGKGQNEVEYYSNLTYGQFSADGFNPQLELGSADEGGPDWARFSGHDIDKLQRIISTSFERGDIPTLDDKSFWPRGNDTPVREILGKIGESYAASPERQFVAQTMDAMKFDRWEQDTYAKQSVGALLDDKLQHEGRYGLSERGSVDKLQDFVRVYAGQGGAVTRDMTIAQALTTIHNLPPNAVAAYQEYGNQLHDLKLTEGQGEKEWEFLKGQPVEDLLSDNIKGHAGRSMDSAAASHRDNAKNVVQEAINKGIIQPPADGGPRTVEQALKEISFASAGQADEEQAGPKTPVQADQVVGTKASGGAETGDNGLREAYQEARAVVSREGEQDKGDNKPAEAKLEKEEGEKSRLGGVASIVKEAANIAGLAGTDSDVVDNVKLGADVVKDVDQRIIDANEQRDAESGAPAAQEAPADSPLQEVSVDGQTFANLEDADGLKFNNSGIGGHDQGQIRAHYEDELKTYNAMVEQFEQMKAQHGSNENFDEFQRQVQSALDSRRELLNNTQQYAAGEEGRKPDISTTGSYNPEDRARATLEAIANKGDIKLYGKSVEASRVEGQDAFAALDEDADELDEDRKEGQAIPAVERPDKTTDEQPKNEQREAEGRRASQVESQGGKEEAPIPEKGTPTGLELPTGAEMAQMPEAERLIQSSLEDSGDTLSFNIKNFSIADHVLGNDNATELTALKQGVQGIINAAEESGVDIPRESLERIIKTIDWKMGQIEG